MCGTAILIIFYTWPEVLMISDTIFFCKRTRHFAIHWPSKIILDYTLIYWIKDKNIVAYFYVIHNSQNASYLWNQILFHYTNSIFHVFWYLRFHIFLSMLLGDLFFWHYLFHIIFLLFLQQVNFPLFRNYNSRIFIKII